MRRKALGIVLSALALSRPVQAAELVMFEEAGCAWCTAWHREIGPIYPKSDEGRIAPLRRVDLGAERPADLAHIKGVAFTPTFVLVHDGREIGRILGYPGADFFWGLLAEMLVRIEPSTD